LRLKLIDVWKGSVVRRRKRSNTTQYSHGNGQGVRATLVLPWLGCFDLGSGGSLADLTSNLSLVSYLS
jgi:hypothetical protein